MGNMHCCVRVPSLGSDRALGRWYRQLPCSCLISWHLLLRCRPRLPTPLSACIALTDGGPAGYALCGDENQANFLDWSDMPALIKKVCGQRWTGASRGGITRVALPPLQAAPRRLPWPCYRLPGMCSPAPGG
jgi:hypothetical protein